MGFKLTTLVVIGPDCTVSCKSNYHMITMALCILGTTFSYILWLHVYLHIFFMAYYILYAQPSTKWWQFCTVMKYIALLFILIKVQMYCINHLHIFTSSPIQYFYFFFQLSWLVHDHLYITITVFQTCIIHLS